MEKTPLQICYEMKYQSMEWKLPKEPSPTKVKASRSTLKVMLIVFWDAEGIILAVFFVFFFVFFFVGGGGCLQAQT